MKKEYMVGKYCWLVIAILMVLLMVGCTETAESCPPPSPVDLSQMHSYFENESLPFQFPLENPKILEAQTPFSTGFAAYGRTTRGPEYHAAEDILQPAGTPVYAMADGKVSFSGPMKGYGWLVIIDHPHANLYSLYGHLSPSRWQIEKGPLQKGELIGYLGDSDENGGSEKNPLRTHLHFGLRVGQRIDYPGMGQWRWQAGWIKPCPQELGWLQPSLVILSQDIHFGERHQPTEGFLNIWGNDILFSSIYIIGGISMFIFAEKQKKPLLLIAAGVTLFGASWILISKGMIMSYIIFTMAVLFTITGIYKLIRRSKKNPQVESS